MRMPLTHKRNKQQGGSPRCDRVAPSSRALVSLLLQLVQAIIRNLPVESGKGIEQWDGWIGIDLHGLCVLPGVGRQEGLHHDRTLRLSVTIGVFLAILIVDAFTEATGKLVVGDPQDPKTQIGSLISTAHRESVEAYIAASELAAWNTDRASAPRFQSGGSAW